MNASKNTTTETYTVEMKMYEGCYFPKFAFNAKDEKDALRKAQGWARYHGMTRDDVRVREANEHEAANWLQNDWVD